MSKLSRVRDVIAILGDVASIASAIGVAVLCLVVGSIYLTGSLGVAVQQPAAARARPVRFEPANGMTAMPKTAERPRSARIAVVEFTDFQCPFCGTYARETLPLIKKEFVDTGRVAYGVRHFPMQTQHPLAFAASMAARCADRQGRHWSMHTLLFDDQSQLSTPSLFQRASDLRLDSGAFGACLGSSEAKLAVYDDIEEGRKLGVRGTPTFFIGTVDDSGAVSLKYKMQGNSSLDSFRSAIEGIARLSSPPTQ